MSIELRDALDELVDPCEGAHGDWEDVLRRSAVARAETAPARPAARRRRRALALALVLLAAAAIGLLATPAFGLREAVLDLIGREDVEFEEGERAPLVVRRQFEDLSLGAPPQMDPRALSEETRRVGTVRVRGRERALWVAPTARGGFCYFVDQGGGGCLRNEPHPRLPAVSVTYGMSQRRGGPVEATSISGWALDRNAARVTVEFQDGTTEDVGFLYISAPIDAGYFSYDVRRVNRLAPRQPSAVVVRDAAGEELGRESIGYRPPGRGPLLPSGPLPPHKLPARPPVAPSEPVQAGTARGVRVVAGANGAVLFDQRSADPEIDRLLRGHAASFTCFRLRDGSAVSLGSSGAYAPTVGTRLFGLETPLDGCEIQGSYGHRWPDRFDSHSPVEIAFTEGGRRYFEERAAARDLALLVRTARVQQIRKLEPADAAAQLASEYGIERLGGRTERPAAGRIGVSADDVLVFRRVATTGRVFEVEIADGRIARENVSGLTKVF